MKKTSDLGLLDHFTHKGNLKDTRYGWLRLTPAYSVHLVANLLDTLEEDYPTVLDPFCGTGTTALVCAERGIQGITTDINPFLIWLTRAKTYAYTGEEISAFRNAASVVGEAMLNSCLGGAWIPPLHQIERWWDETTLQALSRGMHVIASLENPPPQAVVNLLKISFCRTLIERSNVSFGHQSMSFKKNDNGILPFLYSPEEETAQCWSRSVATIAQAACSSIVRQPTALLCDARSLLSHLEAGYFSCVVTSPPYPNRMSYIRELRPYMYWLGYLENGRDAGELDWEAIGGTWGCATSNLSKWQPEEERAIPYKDFAAILSRIAQASPLLSRYVHKYFYDMVLHIKELHAVVQPGGIVHYIVGNSKFYEVMLPVEAILAAIFQAGGFINVTTKAIRKRTSKKELFEYVVSARKPL